MIGRPARVGVMLGDFQIGAVAGEAVEDIGAPVQYADTDSR